MGAKKEARLRALGHGSTANEVHGRRYGYREPGSIQVDSGGVVVGRTPAHYVTVSTRRKYSARD